MSTCTPEMPSSPLGRWIVPFRTWSKPPPLKRSSVSVPSFRSPLAAPNVTLENAAPVLGLPSQTPLT